MTSDHMKIQTGMSLVRTKIPKPIELESFAKFGSEFQTDSTATANDLSSISFLFSERTISVLRCIMNSITVLVSRSLHTRFGDTM